MSELQVSHKEPSPEFNVLLTEHAAPYPNTQLCTTGSSHEQYCILQLIKKSAIANVLTSMWHGIYMCISCVKSPKIIEYENTAVLINPPLPHFQHHSCYILNHSAAIPPLFCMCSWVELGPC